jgi:hypothetical protein
LCKLGEDVLKNEHNRVLQLFRTIQFPEIALMLSPLDHHWVIPTAHLPQAVILPQHLLLFE